MHHGDIGRSIRTSILLCSKFRWLVVELVFAKNLPERISRWRELSQVPKLSCEQHQKIDQVEDGQVAELLVGEVPSPGETFSDFFADGVDLKPDEQVCVQISRGRSSLA